jgi:hypothetical protein
MAVKRLATQDIGLILHLDNKQVLEALVTAREPIAGEVSLYAQLMRLLDGMNITAPVVGLVVNLEDLAPLVPRQLDFLGQLFADAKNIMQITDRLTPRYGIEPFQQVSFNPEGATVPERSFWFKGIA